MSKMINEQNLAQRIYHIRGQEVMLDFELAEIYGYSTKAFNQQVKNNLEKFDDDFYFQLTVEEWQAQRSKKLTFGDDKNLRSKNLTSSWGGARYLPHAFTEQGIYMLMTVLKGDLAVRQSKALVRMFKKMKDYLLENGSAVSWRDFARLYEKVDSNSREIDKIWREQRELKMVVEGFVDAGRAKERLLTDGGYVDADFVYREIYGAANRSIVIMDNYIGLRTLVLLKDIKKDVKCTILTKNLRGGLHKTELEDFRKQYPDVQIEVKSLEGNLHDRFIVIDYGTENEKFYHCGGSSKDAGKRMTMVTEIKGGEELRKIVRTVLI